MARLLGQRRRGRVGSVGGGSVGDRGGAVSCRGVIDGTGVGGGTGGGTSGGGTGGTASGGGGGGGCTGGGGVARP